MKNKIKEMADKLAKSFEENESLKELSNLVKEIGIEATKAAVADLEPEAQELFRKSLEKAASMDKEAQEKTGPEPKQEESEDIEQVSDEDRKKAKGEKLVKESNKEIKPQGDDSELKGQVIKSENIVMNYKTGEVISREDVTEKEIIEKSEEVVVEEDLEKGAVKEAALEDEKSELEGLEKGELLAKMIEKMRKRGMDHDVCMSALQKKGYDTEMAKGKWEESMKAQAEAEKLEKENSKKDSKEVKKSEEIVTEEVLAKSEELLANEGKLEEEIKESLEAGIGAAEEVVEKSIEWDSPNKRLEANARNGQNTHIEVQDYLVKKALDKAKGETLEKSEETPKEFDSNDINDIIEKGYDRSKEAVVAAEKIIRKSKGGNFNTSSFSEEELAKSFGLTVEEMNVVLGKKPQAQ